MQGNLSGKGARLKKSMAPLCAAPDRPPKHHSGCAGHFYKPFLAALWMHPLDAEILNICGASRFAVISECEVSKVLRFLMDLKCMVMKV